MWTNSEKNPKLNIAIPQQWDKTKQRQESELPERDGEIDVRKEGRWDTAMAAESSAEQAGWRGPRAGFRLGTVFELFSNMNEPVQKSSILDFKKKSVKFNKLFKNNNNKDQSRIKCIGL